MRWKSDLKAAECCAASEDESGSLRSGDEVGHADSSVGDVGAGVGVGLVGTVQLRGPGHVNEPRGPIFTILQKQREKKKKRGRPPRTGAIKTQVVNETSSPFGNARAAVYLLRTEPFFLFFLIAAIKKINSL